MIHDFGIVWSERGLLLSGLGNTAILSVLSAVAALLIGFILTPTLMSRRAWLAWTGRGRGGGVDRIYPDAGGDVEAGVALLDGAQVCRRDALRAVFAACLCRLLWLAV